MSVVIYRLFESFAEMGSENIDTIDVVLGSSSFFVVSIGGTLIGIVFGALASFTTKYTENAPILEPLIIISYSYLSYLTAEMTATSSILAYDHIKFFSFPQLLHIFQLYVLFKYYILWHVYETVC